MTKKKVYNKRKRKEASIRVLEAIREKRKQQLAENARLEAEQAEQDVAPEPIDVQDPVINAGNIVEDAEPLNVNPSPPQPRKFNFRVANLEIARQAKISQNLMKTSETASTSSPVRQQVKTEIVPRVSQRTIVKTQALPRVNAPVLSSVPAKNPLPPKFVYINTAGLKRKRDDDKNTPSTLNSITLNPSSRGDQTQFIVHLQRTIERLEKEKAALTEKLTMREDEIKVFSVEFVNIQKENVKLMKENKAKESQISNQSIQVRNSWKFADLFKKELQKSRKDVSEVKWKIDKIEKKVGIKKPTPRKKPDVKLINPEDISLMSDRTQDGEDSSDFGSPLAKYLKPDQPSTSSACYGKPFYFESTSSSSRKPITASPGPPGRTQISDQLNTGEVRYVVNSGKPFNFSSESNSRNLKLIPGYIKRPEFRYIKPEGFTSASYKAQSEGMSSFLKTGSSATPENSKKSAHFDMPDISSTPYKSHVVVESDEMNSSSSTIGGFESEKKDNGALGSQKSPMPDIATALHNIFDSKEVQSSSSTTGSSAPPENSKKSDHFDMPDISSTLYRSRVEPISSSSSGSTSTSAPRYVPKPIAQPARYAIPSPGALNALRRPPEWKGQRRHAPSYVKSRESVTFRGCSRFPVTSPHFAKAHLEPVTDGKDDSKIVKYRFVPKRPDFDGEREHKK